jgi:small subunit ribosomal protein S9
MATTTPTTKKPAAKKSAVKKPRAPKAEVAEKAVPVMEVEEVIVEKPLEKTPEADLNIPAGRYAFATGRRKTSVANVRLFAGKGKNTINNKDMAAYFGGNMSMVDRALKPFLLTGMEGRAYVYINTNGGGIHSQAQAMAHGISLAIATSTPDFRKVLKKNGMLTRDSRMKERKKPGLKRARRGPQWAKR